MCGCVISFSGWGLRIINTLVWFESPHWEGLSSPRAAKDPSGSSVAFYG